MRPLQDQVEQTLVEIRRLRPRFVCVIHSKVRDALNRHAGFTRELDYGVCGPILASCDAQFVLNYFPNGNRYSDAPELRIFRDLKNLL